ncbi:hypothetical protein M5689_018980 [Euphorbia peplus]|nr:hypothetical protein M5689_018980 [Euphorbia peplus]
MKKAKEELELLNQQMQSKKKSLLDIAFLCEKLHEDQIKDKDNVKQLADTLKEEREPPKTWVIKKAQLEKERFILLERWKQVQDFDFNSII